MKKFIIEVRDDISDEDAFIVLSKYINAGKISEFRGEPTYCLLTLNGKIAIHNHLIHKSKTNKFIIYKHQYAN